MASSTKVQFRLETLKEKALESIDFRIAQKRLEVETFGDDDDLAKRIVAWRSRQEEKISNLFSELGPDGNVDDLRLSRFHIDPIPEVDRYDRSRVERELRVLESIRSQVLAKGSSLVPDDEGNISLTSTQLSEFFGL